MGSWVEIGVNNTSLLEENVVEDTSNGAIEVVNMNQEFLSQLLGTRKSMEENLELRRQVKVISQELPMQPRVKLDRDNAWAVGDKEEKDNRILVEHERNRLLNDRANIACD